MFSADLGVTPSAANYIEDVFSTYLYTGNGSTQTITNGIDLSGKGGLVWIKGRINTQNNVLFDTARGAGTSATNNQSLSSNSTAAEDLGGNFDYLSAFNSNGFTVQLGGTAGSGGVNQTTNSSISESYVSWTFRKQAKFFDVVTYTGNGANRTIAHNLGSVPGSIFVKRTDSTAAWAVYHRSLANTQYMVLNTTAAAVTGATYWNSTTPTSSVFSLGTSTDVNASGGTYVAYLFSHDAGGFGATGSDNVISCGSFTGTSKITLGYEPQFVLMKQSNAASSWYLYDTMRGIVADPTVNSEPYLLANLDFAEGTGQNYIGIDATGFTPSSAAVGPSDTWVYIAIRRGPMKTPTTGTSVFGLSARTGTGANATVTGGQTDDAVLIKNRGSAVASLFSSRLTGTGYLVTSSSAAEVAAGTNILQANPWDVMDGVKVGTSSNITNQSGNTYINYLFRRAPGFFDVVCYTGTGSVRTVNHNLGVVPEMMIFKNRVDLSTWAVYTASIGATKALNLNDNGTGLTSAAFFNNTTPTSSVFTVNSSAATNTVGNNHVTYLFASVAGVSKVGSYTGTGTTLQIDCGFTGGARFVLIKRNGTGDWYVWDSARGIVAGNDPYLLLNSTAAEVTSTDYVDTYSAGFEISSTAPAAINANGGSFIFLAIA